MIFIYPTIPYLTGYITLLSQHLPLISYSNKPHQSLPPTSKTPYRCPQPAPCHLQKIATGSMPIFSPSPTNCVPLLSVFCCTFSHFTIYIQNKTVMGAWQNLDEPKPLQRTIHSLHFRFWDMPYCKSPNSDLLSMACRLLRTSTSPATVRPYILCHMPSLGP